MMEIKTEIQPTADGSTTLYRSDIDEHYHSVKGAVAESRHVYIGSALEHRMTKGFSGGLTVLEIGFGTGLNAAMSVEAATDECHITYVSLELYPLPPHITGSLGYSCHAPYIAAVNDAPLDIAIDITPRFTLHKRLADFNSCTLPEGVDVVYFDAFAPEKQPEMWSADGFRRLFEAMNPGGVLTTYCAKGTVRRSLRDTGFDVERIAGPPGGKREILRCTKPL